MNTPRDLADRMSSRKEDSFVRQKFTLPRDEARLRAKREFKAYPSAAYMTQIESWRELGDGVIEFTLKRLPSLTENDR